MNIEKGNLKEAMNYLEKAKKLAGSNSDILTNQGIVFAREGELATAQKLFNQANASENNQAILDIRQGEYSKAARFFKNKKSHNATLAKLMNGENGVSCNEATAACHYLNAISEARSGNNDIAISNLKKAINQNATYKNEAIKDLEFIKLRNNKLFIELTK